MRASPFASLFAASLIALLPTHAFAQQAQSNEPISVRERPRPEYDPLGMRFGGFDLHAGLGLAAQTTDNVLATATNEQDDVVYHVTPEARLRSTWGRHALEIGAGADVQSYQDTSDADVTTYYVDGMGRLDIGTDTNVTARALLAHEAESFANPDALPGQERVEYDRTGASLAVAHTFNRVRLIGTAETRDFDFDDANGVDQDRRDYSEDSLTGRVEVAMSPRLFLVGQVTSDQRDYDNDPAVSSEGMTYLAGVRLELTDLIHGEITAGTFERDYDGATGSVDGTAIAANVEWYVTQLTTLTFHASQGAQEGGASIDTPYTASEYGARVDHELLRNLILSASFTSGKRDYETIALEDETFAGTVEAIYLMNRRVDLNLRYAHEENDSTAAGRDYEISGVYAGLRLHL
ncbi:outer membrane beta-barrel protein [Terricaulis sp.]|uniref:outer membrane beta-barrel protein n=1 Tax=Terricaulis sp. TaxID=2768686 RepID=UPI0037840A83